MAGELGGRSAYRYVSDKGTAYEIYTRDALASAAGLQPVTAGTLPGRPVMLRPRHVWGLSVQSGRDLKQKLICNTSFAGFLNGGTFTIGSASFVITGRVGECESYRT
jgi:hypothetical protein